MNKGKFKLAISVLLILLIVSFMVTLCWGTYKVSPMEVINTLLGNGTKLQNTAILTIRVPRLLVGMFVAIALSTAGAILQTITKNDLADAGILGINSGAALFVVMYIYFLNGNVYDGISDFTIYTMPLVALCGALFGAFLIYALAWNKGINSSRLLLIGIGINTAFLALLTVFQLKFTTQEFNRVVAWTNGSIWGATWKYVYIIAPFVILFGLYAFYKSRDLDVLNLGDEMSTGLGLDVEKERRKMLIVAVVLAGVATSVAGSIAFLGLVSPHIARKLVGPAHKKLIPVASLVGAFILLASDTIARNIFAPLEIPVGLVVSVIGVPYFIYLMLKAD